MFWVFLLSVPVAGQPDGENSTLVKLAFHADPAAMAFDDTGWDGKSKSRSLSHILCCKKRVEQFVNVLFLDAGSIILNQDFNTFFILASLIIFTILLNLKFTIEFIVCKILTGISPGKSFTFNQIIGMFRSPGTCRILRQWSYRVFFPGIQYKCIHHASCL